MQAPQIGVGGTHLPTFCLGEAFANFWQKIRQKLANVLLYAKYNILYQKKNKQNDVCQFLEPQNVGKLPFLEKTKFELLFGHQFWPPQTSPDSF